MATFAAEFLQKKFDIEKSGNMKYEKDKQKSMKPYYAGIGVCLGVGVGAAIGVALDNIAMGVGLGAGIGVALGGAFSLLGSNKDDA